MRPRLRSLELHGYKTFASRTIFEFPGAITAIVGPNGSGKSNISDAIRWVLGEQAYSLLRAKKTDDMIYLGSEFRPRSSMALASVIFDNDDSWLPIDFSEVSLTRRAYRDGDNEYLLNGQRIRLKEITELLSQSGLAERTYTIIGQGSVDAALSLKPEERRKFFEEAAGIGLYRTRREEALNRLETTRRNLERVKDILGELEPRLNGLERQARKAQEYERIKADLKLLLRDWYGYHWHQNQNELAHTHEVVRVQEAQLNTARERQAEIDLHVNEIRTRIQSIRGDLSRLHEESGSFHRQWEELNKTLAVLEEREKAILSQIDSHQVDQVHVEEEQKSLVIQNQSIQTELEKTQIDLQEAREQESAAKRTFEKIKDERDEKERMLENQRTFLLEAETRQVQYRSRQEELIRRLESIQNSSQGNISAREEFKSAVDESVTEVAELTRLVEEDQKSILSRNEEKERIAGEISRLDSEIKVLRQKEMELKASQAKLQAQIDVLKQSERNLAGFAEGSKFILSAAEKGQLRGIFNPLAAKIKVKPEYENAIAAVLGEILEGILLGQDAELENTLALLESGDRGRAIFITAKPSGDAGKNERISDPAILSTGLDALQGGDDLRGTMKILLDQVYITKDRQSAGAICRLLPRWGKVVTLSGEVFSANGVVAAGRESRVKLLSRTRERQELEQELDRLTQLGRELESQIQSLADKQTGFAAKATELDEEAKMQERIRSENHSRLQQAILRREQAKQKLEWVISQFSANQAEIEKLNAEINDHASKQEKNAQDLRQFRDESEATAKLVRGITLDDIQIQLNHWSTQVAVVNQRNQQLQQQREEKEAAIRSTETRKVSLAARLEESKNTLSRTKTEITQMKEQARELSEHISELELQIQPLEKETEEKERELNSLQDAQAAARMAVQVADRHTAQAQLDLSRQKDALESLRNRIEEDFGLVAFEYAADLNGPTPLPLEGMVEQLPVIKELPPAYEENINRQKAQLRRMGPVNLEAQKEYQEVSERFTFLTGQVEDLNKADEDLRQVITELDDLMRREFRKTFDAVAIEFKQIFTRLFNGGQARLELVDEDDPKLAGVDIETKLPGRREQGLNLLSGGERSLTAIALIFALLKISPTPFCILDEVDAALDEANVGRFCDLLKELSENTQFVIITHNRNTVQIADIIYGVTMAKDSTSQVISLKMDELTDDMIRS